ncbi:MAG: hypothetical protein RE471_04480 [Ferroplasma sp.]|uniref:tetratricopeptide repeat protein n=1 Tax=Ferroplasma sp. TaxID=2591003 RepID=UPI00281630C5|nr:hypothetical protein [Ferroplasma sp.]WMT52138.1 MAG: hypothetical protein RE471_04480 [Ferroplasma sp.]
MMIAVEHLMLKKKLKSLLKKARESGSIESFSNFVIKESEEIKNVYDSQISEILEEAFRNQKITEDLFEALNSIDSKLMPVLKYRALKYYSTEDVDGFLDIINTYKELLGIEEIKEAFNRTIGSVSIDIALQYLCKTGIYDKEKFNQYLTDSFRESDFQDYIKIFKENGSPDDLEKILLRCISVSGSKYCYKELADIYMKTGRKTDLKNLVIAMESIFHNNDELTGYYLYLQDYDSVMKYSEKTDQGNAELAEAYYRTGSYESALKIYKFIYYNRDQNVLDRIIEIEHSIQDYYSLLGYISIMERNARLPRNFLQYKIEAEISLEMYSEAESDISRYRSEFDEDREIMKLLIQYYLNTDSQEYAYRIALSLIEKGIHDVNTYRIAVNYLYENHKYEELVKLLEEEEKKREFMPEYCSSLISMGEIDRAVEYLSADRMLLDSGPVVDTLFGFLKSEANIRKFDNLNISGTLLEMVILFIRGRENIDYNIYMQKAYRHKSVACIYIISLMASRKKLPVQKNYIRGLLGVDKYQAVGTIMAEAYSIQTGKVPRDLNDSSYFLYPVTMSLIDYGFYKQAESYIESIKNKTPDPFYYYARALIEQHGSNYGDAIKHIDEAVEILLNVNFLASRINIGLQHNEKVDSYVKLCTDLGFDEVFYKIDAFMEENKIEVKDSLRELLGTIDVRNAGMYRLKAYCMEAYRDKLKFSALSVLHGGTSEDIVKHYLLLKSRNEKIAISFLESYPGKKYSSYIILSSYYYSRRIYKKALEYFNRAYIRNRKALDNPVFQEISTGNIISTKIIEDMKSRNEWFDLFLYYYFRNEYSNVKDIIVKHYTNTKIIEFAINQAWDTMSLKQPMLDLFHGTGDKILGELLAEKFHDLELYGLEIDILKKLAGSNPEETGIQDKLTSALIMNNEDGEALRLSFENYHRLKSVSSFNKMTKTAYNLKDYASLSNIFKNNPDFINKDNIEYYIYAQIKLFNYVGVRVILKEYSDIIPESLKSKIENKIRASYRTRTVIRLTGDLFRVENDQNRVLNFHEMQKYIPCYVASDVYGFITNNIPYSYIDRDEFNIQSKNIMERLYEKGIRSLNKIKIHDIYSVTGDVIKSKNFYIFIGRAMEGYYRPSQDLGEWNFTSGINQNDIPGIMEIMVKYDIGLLDSIAISEKIKKGLI